MNTVTESVFSICVVLVVIELLCKLTSQSNTMKFLRGLIIIMMVISLISSFRNLDMKEMDLDLSAVKENNELAGYVDDSYQSAVQNQTDSYIRGLLNTIQINPIEICVFTNNSDDASIVIERIQIIVQDDTDQTRANALLKNVIDENTDVEVCVK